MRMAKKETFLREKTERGRRAKDGQQQFQLLVVTDLSEDKIKLTNFLIPHCKGCEHFLPNLNNFDNGRCYRNGDKPITVTYDSICKHFKLSNLGKKRIPELREKIAKKIGYEKTDKFIEEKKEEIENESRSTNT